MDNVKICGDAASTTGTYMRTVLEHLYNNTAFPDSAAKLQASTIYAYGYADHFEFGLSGRFFIFGLDGPPENCVQSALNEFAKHPAAAAKTIGITQNAGCIQDYSAIFENTSPDGDTSNLIIENTTAHEFGHQMDFIYAGLGDSSNGLLSTSSQFEGALAFDLATTDKFFPCAYTAQDLAGNVRNMNGLFSFQMDNKNTYICGTDGSGTSLSKGYGALSNSQIYAKAFPESYATTANPNENMPEFFAEAFAFYVAQYPDYINDLGNGINGSDGAFLTPGFACSSLYMYTVTQFGRLPTADELHNTAYEVPDGGPTTNPSTPGYTITPCDGSAGTHMNYDFGN
jgi:hypothetical protein